MSGVPEEENQNENDGTAVEVEHQIDDEPQYCTDEGKPVTLEDPYKKAISYLEEHHIMQIFQVLTTGIVCERPEAPLDYMIEQVEKLRNEEKFQVKKSQSED